MTMPGVLDLSPVLPPKPVRELEGSVVAYEDIIRDSGFTNVVSVPWYPEIRLHTRDLFDYVAPRHGNKGYALSLLLNQKQDRTESAREILRRLAYGCHDYIAREIVARYHRDLKRNAIQFERPSSFKG